eukprot:841561-Alexandrium_andersonii.AAC.1
MPLSSSVPLSSPECMKYGLAVPVERYFLLCSLRFRPLCKTRLYSFLPVKDPCASSCLAPFPSTHSALYAIWHY